MMANANIPQFPVNVFTQRGETVYSLVMSASDLAKYARVERYEDTSDGVNRKLDERHAMRIAEYMLEPKAVMLDAICGDLRGDWQIINNMLVGDEDSYLSIDDGQHRWWAVTNLLVPEERSRWSFPTVATMGLDYETRMAIFLQQSQRKSVDSKLSLAMKHELGRWNNDAERESYTLLLALNSETGSPLQGKIILGETLRRSYESRYRPEGINANGLWNTLRSVMGSKSPLAQLSMEKRIEVVRNIIWVAKETWPKDWESDHSILTTARGINSIITMIRRRPSEFQVAINNDFSIDNLRRVFRYAKSFKWHANEHKNASDKTITEALDKAIGAGMRRDRSVQLVA